MPSRTDFLKELVPITTPNEDDNCPICFEPLTDPVKLPKCTHIFDRECITIWFQGPQHNTCPTCRAICFDISKDENGVAQLQRPQPGSQAARAGIRRALRRSGLQESRSPQLTTMDTFGLGNFFEEEIYQASVDIAEYTRSGGGTTDQGELFVNTADGGRDVVQGMVDLNTTKPALLARIVAITHFIIALRAGGSEAYTEQNSRDLAFLMTVLGPILKDIDGMTCDINLLAGELRRRIMSQLAEDGRDIESPVFGPRWIDGRLNMCKQDFECVLDYVGYFCFKEQQEADRGFRAAEQLWQGSEDWLGRWVCSVM